MDTENAGREFPGEYRLDVEDFGPIAKASVDLRPLTVFIGPSNTGKSYLAILVYALHQCFGEGNLGPHAWRPRYRDQLLGLLYGHLREAEVSEPELLDSFRFWLQMIIDNRFQSQLPLNLDSRAIPSSDFGQSESHHVLPERVDAYIRSVFERSEGLHDYAYAEIIRCFGVEDISDLIRRFCASARAKISLSIPRMNDVGIGGYDLNLEEDIDCVGKICGAQSLTSEIQELNISENLESYIRKTQPSVIDGAELSYALARVTEGVFRSLIKPLHRNAYYLPADRTGVMHSHQVVVSALVQKAAAAGIQPSSNIPVLSGVLADFLSQLIGVSGERGSVWTKWKRSDAQRVEKLATGLEQDVLKGSVHVENSESGYPSVEFLPDGWSDPLPLKRASSMVSELAPVVLYLRHLVQPDDVLIIEEPESHLHPGMQVEFTRQLAGLVRAGIRVIVTTHSEWVLQELANVVRASALEESKRVGIAGGDVTLEPDEVGAWLFKPGAAGEGSTVSPIPLDEESGLYPTDFEDVAVAMHNDWATILSRLGEDE